MGNAAVEILKVKDIYMSYNIDSKKKDKLLVLHKINLSVKRGEFLAIVGPSGCGKSTLLGVISGFLKGHSGQVFFKGQEIKGPDTNRIVIFQDDNQLFPWKTLLQNVLFPLQVKNSKLFRSEMECSARKYLKLVDLENFSNYYPHQLSGGMKQRGALARALVTEPEIMLMDEPFGSLDSQTRAALQAMLLEIWQKTGGTVVFITHDINEAVFLADRIVVMGTEPGQIKRIIINRLERPRRTSDPLFSGLFDQISEILAQK